MQSNTSEGQPMLKIVSKTWARDSHGLFDYEATQVRLNNIIVNGRDTRLIRKRNDVKQCNVDADLELDERELCQVLFDMSKYYVNTR